MATLDEVSRKFGEVSEAAHSWKLSWAPCS